MKYYEVKFTFSCPAELLQDARDVLSALAGEAGFETFVETGDGLTGYVRQQLFSDDALRAVLAAFPFGADAVAYTLAEAEDRDWNEQWEQQGFEPISLPGLVIHDGRHLPDIEAAQIPKPLSIEIDAHMAFGTGTHETTRLMCRRLLTLHLRGKRVLDCGCGTGILAITALKLGAASAVAYDIDEWSVDNTRHNAVINHVDHLLEVAHGDATLLYKWKDAVFDVVMANINRNILMADMPHFVRMLASDGLLLLSGFYNEDVPLLARKAAELGLEMADVAEEQGWACMELRFINASFDN